jgi:hypothetical protein
MIAKAILSRWTEKNLTHLKWLAGFFLVSGAIGAVVWINDRGSSRSSEGSELQGDGRGELSVDTLIPAGMVLVPIEIQNLDSLDSLLGQNGVVDLYATAETGGPSKRVARQVGIYRAPLNPRQFAVLVRDAEAPSLVRTTRPFFVVMQNPKQRDRGQNLASGSGDGSENELSRSSKSRRPISALDDSKVDSGDEDSGSDQNEQPSNGFGKESIRESVFDSLGTSAGDRPEGSSGANETKDSGINLVGRHKNQPSPSSNSSIGAGSGLGTNHESNHDEELDII